MPISGAEQYVYTIFWNVCQAVTVLNSVFVKTVTTYIFTSIREVNTVSGLVVEVDILILDANTDAMGVYMMGHLKHYLLSLRLTYHQTRFSPMGFILHRTLSISIDCKLRFNLYRR